MMMKKKAFLRRGSGGGDGEALKPVCSGGQTGTARSSPAYIPIKVYTVGG